VITDSEVCGEGSCSCCFPDSTLLVSNADDGFHKQLSPLTAQATFLSEWGLPPSCLFPSKPSNSATLNNLARLSRLLVWQVSRPAAIKSRSLSLVVSYFSHACLNVIRPLRRAISAAK